MSRLSDQIASLEDEVDWLRHELVAKEECIDALGGECEDLQGSVDWMTAYIEWFDATYPEAKIAYEVSQRVST